MQPNFLEVIISSMMGCFLLFLCACGSEEVLVNHVRPTTSQKQYQYFQPTNKQNYPKQTTQQQYYQQSPYYQQRQNYYNSSYQRNAVIPGSRNYSDPYAIPPSSDNQQYYDADQFYVPPVNDNRDY
jgi:hypothetical protein